MIKTIIAAIAILTLSGCGSSSTSESTANGTILKTVVSAQCVTVPSVYFPTQQSTKTYFQDTAGLSIFWDNRYGIISTESGCENSSLANSIHVDAYTQELIVFGGPQSTLIYRLNNIYPWRDGNNLSMQLTLRQSLFSGIGGGNNSFNFFIVNSRTGEQLNYVISITTNGSAWDKEQPDILFDPTTNTSFISTTVSDASTYVDKSPLSVSTNDLGFFRVNLPAHLLPVENPAEWYVLFIGVQHELEEEIGRGVIDVNFIGFSAYITDGII